MHDLAETTSRILDSRFLGNPVRELLLTLVGILIGLGLVRVFQVFIIHRLRKVFASTATTWDDLLISVLERNVVPALYVLIVYWGVRDFHMKPFIHHGLRSLVTVILTLSLIRVGMKVVSHSVRSYWARQGSGKTAAGEKNLNGIITMVQILIWILGLILLLDNLGIKVSAFVAGLGITGIAVALAAQTILGDLFAYFVIFFDQPFVVGHVIRVDNYVGEVEHIGLKTTRLRSMDGEQIIVSNKFLTDSRVQNYMRMERRRVVFSLDLDPATSAEALRGVQALIKSLFVPFPDVTLERCHFKQFTETGFRFETAFMVETADFGRYMDVQHEVNLSLREALSAAGLQLAVPARTLQVRIDAPGDGEGFASGASASAGEGEKARPDNTAGPG